MYILILDGCKDTPGAQKLKRFADIDFSLLPLK